MIFLSKTSSEPYEIIGENNPLVMINNISTLDPYDLVNEVEQDIYLVVKDGFSYNDVKVVVENEYFTGASVYISETTAGGDPIEYKKSLSLGNLSASGGDLVIRLKVKFSLINNPEFLKVVEFPANINIYAET